ncbi:calcium ATPase [Basidiobolus meristosporus CBS 931.73]|uniref:Calcium ATPase n=1 Tax=Basidiobolus meristosporus CBS 931.73 TaxID=1314790 RepID=A0A1Y1WTB0_9FUNG|nr:calcium ATPase [Basidiobolus meristosporus CBS 931.73]|eukprot:ORX76780.1 calcium ATPase [Basidiobolus meristosporus CBS 931.73]
MNNESIANLLNRGTLQEVSAHLSNDTWEPWKLSVTEVADKLAVDPSVGLDQREAQLRLKLFGENQPPDRKRRLKWHQFVLHVVTDPVIFLLIAVCVLYLLWYNGMGALPVVLVVVLTLGTELSIQWKGNLTVDTFTAEIPENVLVVREGHERIVVSRKLVPGDIVIVSYGQRVPADGILINSQHLRLDESIFTGGYHEVQKYTSNEPYEANGNLVSSGYLYFGSSVVQGKGVLIVTATGKHTRLANVKSSTIYEDKKTPLQALTRNVTLCLALLALLVSSVLPVVGLLNGIDWHDALLTGMGMAFVLIPSKLPSLVNAILIVSAHRLSQRRLLLRRLDATEALGSVSAIVTDKTGTLTCNELKVASAIVLTRPDRQSPESFQINCRRIPVTSSKDIAQYLLPLTITWTLSMDQFASDMLFQMVQEGHGAGPAHSSPLPLARGIDKDVFDSAIFDFFSSAEIPVEVQRYLIQSALLVFSKFPVPISEEPFDVVNRVSFRTRGSTRNRTSGSRITVVRGAPESILDLCNRIWVSGYERECSEFDENHPPQIDPDMLNDVEVLTGYITSKLTESINDVARKGSRIFGYAYSTSAHTEGEELPRDFIFVGAYVFTDPIRKEVPHAVSECQEAGIKVVMATGDYPGTALAIASKVGINQVASTEQAPVLLGRHLDEMSSGALLGEAIERTDVFARVTPAHKLRIVQALQSQGHVVAFIGDGIKDATALYAADVGITIGGAAATADMASDHASLVVLGNHFDAVVYCLREGRHMFDNMNKVVTFYLACKLGLASLFTLAIILRASFPLNLVQIILLEMFVNLGSAITFVVERAEIDIMRIPPTLVNQRGVRKGHLGSAIGRQIVFYAALLLLSTGSSYFYGAMYSAQEESAATMLFVSYLINHITLGLAIRSRRTPIRKQGLFSNGNFLMWFALVVSCILAYIFLPTLRATLDLTTLNQCEWLVILTGALCLLIVSEVCKELCWHYAKREKERRDDHRSSERAPLLI